MGIVSNALEGELMHFSPVNGSAFRFLIQKIFHNCAESGLSKGSLIRWLANHLFDLDDTPLDVMLKK